MRITKLVKELHPEFGSEGFHIVGLTWQEPGNGMTLAHDLLEHFPGDRGTMEEEMMALGAALFVRGDDYYGNMPPYSGDFAWNFASDFPNFAHYFDNDGRTGERLKYPGISRLLPEDIEDSLNRMNAAVFNEFLGEELPLPKWVENFNDIKGWMRKGYRKAKARYRHMVLRGGVPWMFFIEVEKQLDEALKKTELHEHIHIAIDITRYQVDIRYPERSWE